VNVVTEDEYYELCSNNAIISSEIYAVHGNPFRDNETTITYQEFDAGEIVTHTGNLSIICLTSDEQY
jgi:hypothetical protein